jgi:hypothetical protein
MEDEEYPEFKKNRRSYERKATPNRRDMEGEQYGHPTES